MAGPWLDELLGIPAVHLDGTLIKPRRAALNLIPGSGVAITGTDDTTNERTDLAISLTGVDVTSIDLGPADTVLQSDGASNAFEKIEDRHVAADAAIAGTKLAPDFGAQDIVTEGSISLGSASVASQGDIRLSASGAVYGLDSNGLQNRQLLGWDADTLTLGNVLATLSLQTLDQVQIGGASPDEQVIVDVTSGQLVLGADFNTLELDQAASFDLSHNGVPIETFYANGTVRNLGLFGTPMGGWESGDRVAFLANRTAAPSAAATSGAFFWSESNELTFFSAHAKTYFAVGTNPAAAGVIRLPNGEGITGRNAAGNGDITAYFIDSSNVLHISNSNSLFRAANVQYNTGGVHRFYWQTSQILIIGPTGVTFPSTVSNQTFGIAAKASGAGSSLTIVGQGAGTGTGGDLILRAGDGATFGRLLLQDADQAPLIEGGVEALGFFGATPAGQQDVSGSRGGIAALASLLTALATLGLITDSSTA